MESLERSLILQAPRIDVDLALARRSTLRFLHGRARRNGRLGRSHGRGSAHERRRGSEPRGRHGEVSRVRVLLLVIAVFANNYTIKKIKSSKNWIFTTAWLPLLVVIVLRVTLFSAVMVVIVVFLVVVVRPPFLLLAFLAPPRR